MKLPLLALCTTLLCCGPAQDPLADCAPTCQHSGPDTRVCIDSELPETARQGVRMWASVLCDRSFSMQIIDGAAPIPAECDYTILLALSTWPWVSQAPPGTAAFAEPGERTAWIVLDVCPPELVRAATAHELGHLLGIAQDADGIMSDPVPAGQCITTANVQEIP